MPTLVFADYTMPEQPLSSSQLQELSGLVGRELQWFPIDRATIIGSADAALTLNLYSISSKGRFCRYRTLKIVVDKSLSEIQQNLGTTHHVAEIGDHGCDAPNLNYVVTGSNLITDFLIENILSKESSVLEDATIVEAVDDIDCLVLTKLFFVYRGSSAVLGMEWAHTDTDIKIIAYVDVIDGQPVVLQVGGGESI